MANKTQVNTQIHGTNPQFLIEKIVRSKILDSTYFKRDLFGLTAETLVDKAVELTHIGGTYGGNRKPSHFLCLLLKMLQITLEKDIIYDFITQFDHKYVRLLGAFYLRLVGKPADVYRFLELLFQDWRKVRRRLSNGKFVIIHIDEVANELITSNYAFDISLPYLPSRVVLEASDQLEQRVSILDVEIEEKENDLNKKEKHIETIDTLENSSTSPLRTSRSRSPPRRKRSRDDESRHRRHRSRSRSRERTKSNHSHHHHHHHRERNNDKKKYRLKLKQQQKREEEDDKISLSKSKQGEEAKTVEEWNAVRKSLGLKPLAKQK